MHEHPESELIPSKPSPGRSEPDREGAAGPPQRSRRPRRNSGKRANGEGSIYFHEASNLWRATVSLENGKRKYLSGKTRQDVAKKLTGLMRDVQHGLPIPSERLSVAQHLAEWLNNTVKPSRRQGTFLRYETATRLHIIPVIGKVPLARLGPQHVQKLQAELLAKGLGPKSINLVRATLSGALNQAAKWGLIVRNPVPLVDPPHQDTDEPQPLTPEQAAAFLEAARGHEFEQLFTLMLATGLRIGEALGLTWAAEGQPLVDLNRRRLHVRRQLTIIPGEPWQLTPPKSKSGRRTVPLIPAAVTALRAQKARVAAYRLRTPAGWPPHDLVFVDELGSPLVGRRVERVFKQLLQRAGLSPTLTPHNLRHSTATYLMAKGVPPRVIMEIMGHSSLAMTARYQHVMESVLEDAADQLASIFPAAAV